MTKNSQKILGMKAEIKKAIALNVAIQQAKSKVNIPAFLEERSRYRSLQIRTVADLKHVYNLFFERHLVSGKFC